MGGVTATIMARFHLMVVAHAKLKFSFLSRYFLGEENTECRSSVVGVCSASSSHCWRVISSMMGATALSYDARTCIMLEGRFHFFNKHLFEHSLLQIQSLVFFKVNTPSLHCFVFCSSNRCQQRVVMAEVKLPNRSCSGLRILMLSLSCAQLIQIQAGVIPFYCKSSISTSADQIMKLL